MKIKEINYFFNELKSAILHKKLYISFRNTPEIESIAKALQELHLLNGYTYLNSKKTIQFFLRYDLKGACVIKEILVVSASTKRIVITWKHIKVFLNDYPYSTAIIYTSRGIMNIQQCFYHRIGGEVLAYFK